MTREEKNELLNKLLKIEENNDIGNLTRAERGEFQQWINDAIEQEHILDRVREEIVDTLYVDSLIFGELIDFRNGKISADDVIEEFNRVTRIEVLQIIDKYKAESEDDE
jgi:hypothetical protein